MKRGLSSLAAAGVVALTVLTASVGGTTAAGAATSATDPVASAFGQLTGCMASGRPLYAQFVVDESQSLEQTDPSATRRQALLTALSALTTLESDDRPVFASMATFASEYIPRVPWGRLDVRHTAALTTFADEQVPRLHRGIETDYLAALSGAAASTRSAVGGQSACQALFFFTDGGLDLRAGDEATAAAAESICQPNGVADALRQQGLHLLAFGLLTQDGAGSVTAADRQRLQSVAEGSAGGMTCGTAPVTSPRAAGAYLPADQALRLGGLFESAIARIGGYSAAGQVSCPGPACVDGVFPFQVDPGIRRVRVVVTGAALNDLRLTGPDGETSPVETGRTARLGTAEVGSTVLPGLARIDLRPNGAAGRWVLSLPRASAGVPLVVEVFRSSGLALRIDGEPQVRAGTSTTLTVAAVDDRGVAVDPGQWSPLALTGLAGGAPLTLTRDGSVWKGPLALPRSGFPASLPVELSLRLVSRPSQLELDPVRLSAQLPVLPPVGLPGLTRSTLELPELDGEGTTTGPVEVVGSDQGPTKVCFGQPDLTGPESAGGITATVSPQCLEVAVGGRAEASVSVTPGRAADGQVTGTVPVSLVGQRPGEQAEVQLTVRTALRRPVDESTRWLWIGGLTVAALLFPLAFLCISGRRAARVTYDVLQVADVPVRLSSDGLRRTGASGSFAFTARDFRFQPPPERERTCAVAPGVVLAASAPLRRLFAPVAALRADEGQALWGPGGRWGARSGSAGIDLGAPTAWVLVCDAGALPAELTGEDWELQVRLVALRGQDGPETLSSLNDELADFSAWTRAAEHLVAQAPAPRGHEEASPAGRPDASTESESLLDHHVPRQPAPAYELPLFTDTAPRSRRTGPDSDDPPPFL